jgi:hypothetical protein
MRRLTASMLAITALAVGTFSGVAMAASPPTRPAVEHMSVDRSASKRDRAEHRSRHEADSRDRSSHEREGAESQDR